MRKKILIIQQKMIGDVLTSSILFEALRKEYPDAQLHYLVYEHTAAVVENNPNIDKILLFDRKKHEKPAAFLSFLKTIKAEAYDVIIDVYAKINTAMIIAASGAAVRISYRKWYTKFAYTHTFTYKKHLATNAGFAVENRMQLLQALSPDFPLEIKPKIYLTSEEKRAAENKLKNGGISSDLPLIMCGILGSSDSKTYPLPYMAQVLDKIVAETGAQLLFNYIPKQKRQAQDLVDLCALATKKLIFFDIFGTSLREFMALTSHCNALIGNEGGAVNMAKALDIPTFAIFSPQIEKQNWNLYENGDTNVSVHLKDFKPEIFENRPEKEIKKSAGELYQLFEPKLFLTDLKNFLKQNLQ